MYLGLSILNSHLKNIIDNYGYSTLDAYIKMSEIIWVDPSDERAEAIVFFEDELLRRLPENSEKPKILLLTEPFETSPINFKILQNRHKYFNLILTFDDYVLNNFENARRYLVGGTFLQPFEKIEISKSKKGISLVASEKKITEGHILRHDILSLAKKTNREIEVFGRTHNEFKLRKTPFTNFSYSVVVENVQKPGFFTEKLIDPLLFKTIPIYWGAQDIGKTFDLEGILTFSTIRDLELIIDKINANEIRISSKSIAKNQKIAFQLMSKELNIQNEIVKFLNNGNEEASITDLLRFPTKYLDGSLSLEDCYNEISKNTLLKSTYAGRKNIKTSNLRKLYEKVKKCFN